MHHKLMAAMAERDALKPLAGNVQLDDACLGGERPGVGGRGSPNKVPIVAAVSTSDAGRPMRVKLAAVGSFTREAIANWAKANLPERRRLQGVQVQPIRQPLPRRLRLQVQPSGRSPGTPAMFDWKRRNLVSKRWCVQQ